MENEPVIYWSRGNIAEKVSHVEGVDVKVREFDSDSQRQKNKSTKSKKYAKPNKVRTDRENKTKPTPETHSSSHKASTSPKPDSILKQSKSQNFSLKNLCFEDKQRVANLIRELARANEDKSSTEATLNNERKKFNVELKTLKEDKSKIEAEQHKLLQQYNECQQLLTHYQHEISEQQKVVANDISKLLNATPLLKHNNEDSNSKPINLPTQDNHDITVHELKDNDTQRSLTDRTDRNEPFSIEESCLSEIPILDKENNHDDDFNIPTRDRNEKSYQAFLSHDQTSNIEEYAKSLTDAFENRVKKLSPKSKRQALMEQKQSLENEQLHLQQLLQQQEDMLRKRQHELKHRHKIYTEKMRTCNRCNNHNKSINNHNKSINSHNKSINSHNKSINKSNDFMLTRSSDSTNLRSTKDSTSFSRNNPQFLPEYQPRHAVLYDDVSSLSNSGGTDIRVRSHISSDTPLQQEDTTMERGYRPSSSVRESRGRYENAPWRSLQLTNHGSASSSRDQRSIDHVTDFTTSTDKHNSSVHGRFTSSTIDPTLMTSSPLKPAYVTSSAVDRDILTSSKIESQSDAESTRKPTFATSSAIEPGFVTSSLLDRDADHVSSISSNDVTPRKSLHATMNNISTLSDLVESTDLSSTDHRRFTQSYSTSYRSSEVTGSTTFDPDDSEILKDIFFIR